MRMILTCIGAWGRNEQQLGHPCQGRGLRPLGRPSIAVSGPAQAGIRSILALATLFVLVFAPASAQVQYDALSSYALRRVNPAYTGNLVQVRRSCDNATMMVGQTACGDLDTNAIKTFALANGIVDQLGSPAVGAYSLRRMRCGYTGPMIRVRRGCDNAQTDIGTTATGDLDTTALKSFVLGAGPLNMITAPANVAYSLRRLYCGYAGPAIRVRRSSDNALQDIGFTVNGDLDTVALKNFVTTGSGFVTIWYDQSGSGVSVSPPAVANQPRAVNAGVVQRRNGDPTLFFDGVDDFFATNSFPTTGYTGFSASVIAAWTTVGNSISNIQALIDNSHFCGGPSPGFIMQDRPDWVNRPLQAALTNPTMCGTCPGALCQDGITTGNGSLRLLTWVNNTTNEFLYRDGGNVSAGTYCGAYTIQNRFLIGAWNSGPSRFISGQMSEVILFRSALSNTDRQILEYLQSLYYGIAGPAVVSIGTGAANAFVSTWYDQSGNNRHVTQGSAATQPQVMNAGQLYYNGSPRPAVLFNGSQGLTHPYVLPTQPVSTSCVWRATSFASPGGELFGWGDNGGNGRRYGVWVSRLNNTQGFIAMEQQGTGIGTPTISNINTWYINTQVMPGSNPTSMSQWLNGTLQVNQVFGTPVNSTISGGEFCLGNIPTAIGANQGHRGLISESIYFPAALSTTDRQRLEFSQSTYYGIAGPAPVTLSNLPSVFVTSWLDQSGSGNQLAQATNSRQPELMTFGVIWRINGRPAIKGTNANQTNLTTIFPTAQVGSRLTANGIVQTDEGSNGNRRIMSLGNDLLNSSDWSNAANCNINQRNTNQFFIERNGVSPGFSATIGVPFAFSMRFSGTTRQLFNNGVGTATVGDGATFDFRSLRLLQSINPCCEGSEALTGRMSEYGLYMRSLSETRRILLESNQGAYYGMAITGAKYALPTGSTYFRYVNGIGRESATDSVAATRESAGMGISVGTGPGGFLKDNGDYLTIGMSCPAPAYTTANVPSFVTRRWSNDWYLNIADVGANNGTAILYFDHSDYGLPGLPDPANLNVLLTRSAPGGNFSVVPSASATVVGDRVLFTVDASLLQNNRYYTLGTFNALLLPIELLSFRAIPVSLRVDLSWATATEINNAYFTVERSMDTEVWEAVATLTGAGNSQSLLNYYTVDNSPLPRTSYYRLRQTDFDGATTLSDIVPVHFEGEVGTLNVFPNPAQDQVTVIYDAEDGDALLNIFNDLGQMMTLPVRTNEGRSEFDVSTLPTGAYVVMLITNGTVITHRLVVRH